MEAFFHPISCIGQGAPPPPSSALPKAKHAVPMLSLFSVNSTDEVRSWHKKLTAKLSALDHGSGRGAAAEASSSPPRGKGYDLDGSALSWVVEPKVDGLAMSLLYNRDGKLMRVSGQESPSTTI